MVSLKSSFWNFPEIQNVAKGMILVVSVRYFGGSEKEMISDIDFPFLYALVSRTTGTKFNI